MAPTCVHFDYHFFFFVLYILSPSSYECVCVDVWTSVCVCASSSRRLADLNAVRFMEHEAWRIYSLFL